MENGRGGVVQVSTMALKPYIKTYNVLINKKLTSGTGAVTGGLTWIFI
jgi:hypothetical protein